MNFKKYVFCLLFVSMIAMGSTRYYTPNELSHRVSLFNTYTPSELNRLKIKSLLRQIPGIKITQKLLDDIDDRQSWVERYIREKIQDMNDDVSLEQQERAVKAARLLLIHLTHGAPSFFYVTPSELDTLLAEEQNVSQLPKFNRHKLDSLKNNEKLQAAIQELNFQDEQDRYNFAVQDAELEALEQSLRPSQYVYYDIATP
ncbi:hypothetical protein KBD08_00790 [Candidatus Babeliales bacterium]|nr:hypothetical protein [Candidatus Babeliales bacterium]